MALPNSGPMGTLGSSSFRFCYIYLSSAASVYVSTADTLFKIETGIERNESFGGLKFSSKISNYIYRIKKKLNIFNLNNCSMSDKNNWARVLKERNLSYTKLIIIIIIIIINWQKYSLFARNLVCVLVIVAV